MTHLIIFDLDGTLVDTAPSIVRSLDNVLKAHNLKAQLPEAEKRYWALHNAQSLVQHAWPVPLSQTELQIRVHELIDDYRHNLLEGVCLFPGVFETLSMLHQKGWSMAICSNKSTEFVHRLTNALEIEPYFSVMLGGNSLALKKPSGKPLEAIMDIVGASRDYSIMVGDTWIDLHASQEAAIPFVGFDFYHKDTFNNLAKNMHILYAWDQLVALLGKLYPRAFLYH